MSIREKKPVKKITDAATAEEVLSEYAIADARMREINAKLDQKIAKLREENSAEIDTLTIKRDECFERIQDYAEDNAKLFVAKRSLDMAHGTIGFRTGTPKVKPLSKKFTFASITELAKQFLKPYVRTVDELAKDKIIADRDKIEPKKLEQCGIAIVQDETFYIELKTEETAPVK
jgi:phage host-nuclease inhibitor protein Gam